MLCAGPFLTLEHGIAAQFSGVLTCCGLWDVFILSYRHLAGSSYDHQKEGRGQ